MMDGILRIYGKPTCPHTLRALNAHPTALFIDVLESQANLDEMLKYTEGQKKIPVIVDEKDNVTIGFNRGS